MSQVEKKIKRVGDKFTGRNLSPDEFRDKVSSFLNYYPIKDDDNKGKETYEEARKLLFAEMSENYHFCGYLKEDFGTFLKNLAKKDYRQIINFSELFWTDIAFDLIEMDNNIIAEDFCLYLYKLLIEIQIEFNQRLHKGAPLHNIGVINLKIKNLPKAKRYFQLALTEDIITRRESYERDLAYIVLKNEFQVPEEELKALDKKIQELLQEAKDSDKFYPEKFILEFQLDKHIVKSRDSDRQLFDINTSYAESLFNNANNALVSSDKGKALEKLLAYLFSSIYGFEVKTNVKTKDAELDLLIRNTIKNDPLYDVLGKFILVECKNWEGKAGVPEVKNFIANIRFSYCRVGILLASKGITGNPQDKKNAELIVLKEFHQDNITVIVLTNEDLKTIVEGKRNLLSILLDKYEDIKLDK